MPSTTLLHKPHWVSASLKSFQARWAASLIQTTRYPNFFTKYCAATRLVEHSSNEMHNTGKVSPTLTSHRFSFVCKFLMKDRDHGISAPAS